MEWLDRARNLFRPRGQVFTGAQHPLEQAAAIATSPLPRLDDYGHDGSTQASQFFALDGPTPAHIEWICSLSDELGRTISRLRTEVWRRGLHVIPLHPKFCANADCGEGFDEEMGKDEEVECHLCGHVGIPVEPDPAERSHLEDFKDLANRTYREDLVGIGERFTEEMLKHGRGYLFYNMLYETDDEGIVKSSSLKGVYAGQSARIVPLHRKDGLPGGKFICIDCRMKPGYKAEDTPGRCGCGSVLYEATLAQMQSIFGGSYDMYWLPEEFDEVRWPYKDGTGPVRRLWPKVSTLLMMDWYAAWALDPKRDKRPDRYLITMGGDLGSIVAQLKANAEVRKKNPYAVAHIHIPSPPGGLNEAKLGAEVLDMGDKEFKGQMLDLREVFDTAVRRQYHLSSLTAGDDQEGGLGQNDQPKLRTSAQVAEDIQRLLQKSLRRLSQKLGATQWSYAFHPALDDDDSKKAEDLGKWLTVATQARDAGLKVEWRAGKPHIHDGEVGNPAMEQQQGMMGGQEEALPSLDMEEETDSEEDPDYGEVDGVPIVQKGD